MAAAARGAVTRGSAAYERLRSPLVRNPVGWHVAALVDVPAGDGWLSTPERDVLARLSVPPRRADWRLGRWVTKRAVTGYLGLGSLPLARLSVLAAPDGAPEAWRDDARLEVAVSLSHRAGLAVAVAGPPGCPLGIDLELVEPRRPEFLADWFGDDERAAVTAAAAGAARDRAVATVWTLKEAAAKALREGLRLDVRDLRTTLLDPAALDPALLDPTLLDPALPGTAEAPDGWRAAAVTHAAAGAGPQRFDAWVRDLDRWVVAIAAPRELGPPVRLQP